MTDQVIQTIFRDRHILVHKTPLMDEGFSIDTLSRYANVNRTVEVLGSSLLIAHLPPFNIQQICQCQAMSAISNAHSMIFTNRQISLTTVESSTS